MNIFKISIISLVLFSQSIIIARSQTEIVYNENHCPDITSLYSTHPDRPFRYGYPLNYFNLSIDYQNQLLAYGIQKGDKVCIIEAMKTFNEIESEISGKIVKVLVDNASPVDYDQPLFLVDPA